MNEEAHFLLKCWESVSDWISNGDKQDAANALVEAFIEAGNTLNDLYDADGEDQYIDRALEEAQSAHEDEDGLDDLDEEEF